VGRKNLPLFRKQEWNVKQTAVARLTGPRRAGRGRNQQLRDGSGCLRQGIPVVSLDFIVNFLAMHRDLTRRFNAQFNHVPLQPHYFDSNAAVDDDAFAVFSRKY